MFQSTVRATCLPPKSSNEEFAAFLMVANEYGLNPITREIYAFPKKGGGIQPIVGIDGWMNLINSHPQMDGMEFVDELNEKGKMVSVTCRIFRKDRKTHTEVTEYMDECHRPTEPWQKWPKRMLRHKAAIQCARYAFGFAGIIDPEEAERSPEVVTGELVAPPPPVDATIVEDAPEPQSESSEFEIFLSNANDEFAVADDQETLTEIWNDNYEPRFEDLSKDEQEQLTGLYSDHCARVGVEDGQQE
ncbi:phage recombination protein Bet [Maritalea porphyrae]|nr:phage recombination protein Bet [Maritalea porphyrae]MCZ4270932.1 phage recombination protein Bet [Maritalea porphyrae]